MIVSYAAKKMRDEMPDPGMKKSQRREAILNELMLGPSTGHLIDRLEALLSLLQAHMIPENVGNHCDSFNQGIQDFNRLLEVIRNATDEE